MRYLKKITAIVTIGLAALSATARPTVLSIADHLNDSTIIYPESVETDTHKLLQNWYMQTYTALDRQAESTPDVEVSDQELIERLGAIPTTIEMPFNSVVKSYINMYTGRKRGLVEAMLGMSLYYMPIFEAELDKRGLPQELKYLPIIESALDPNAVSRAGATGLWQLMLPTARGLGVEVNTLIDDRRDPVRSSEAAATYLKQLYNIYNDWSLAIAAYNCGPGNVNKALRRAGVPADGISTAAVTTDPAQKKDFWAIYPYLPAETRGYVPGFIAATYVMTYYNRHNISPALAKRPIITDSVHVHHRVHFKQIADILQIPVEEIAILNPQYRQQIIPGDTRECSLVLPANQVYAYVMSEKAIAEHDRQLYAHRDVVEPATGIENVQGQKDGQEGEWVTTEQIRYHKVRSGETMASIAKKYGVSLWSLTKSNRNISKPRRGQKLKVVTSKRVFKPADNTATPQADNLLVRNDTQTVGDAAAAAIEAEASQNSAASAINDAVREAEAAEAAKAGTDPDTAAENGDTGNGNATAAPERSGASSAVTQSFSNSHAKQQQAKTAKSSNKAKAARNSKKKKQQTKTVTVKKGDSLSRIAKRNGTTVSELRRLNGNKGDMLQPGDKIRVK